MPSGILRRNFLAFIALMLVAHMPSGAGAEDDESSDGGDGGVKSTDPYAGAASMDTTLSVSITSVSWEVKKEGDKMVDHLSGMGTSSGDVDHCAYAIVLHYDDDSVTHEEFKPGPIEEEYEDYGSTYFGGKDSPDDWSSWKLDIRLEYEYRESQGEGGDGDAVKITEVVVYIRAYGNASDEGSFHQASISKGVSVDGEELATADEKEEEDDDDDGVIPGFGSALLLISMGIVGVVMILARRRR
jgi:hypothetical protein